MKLEDKILLEENEIKPNLYVANAFSGVALLAIVIEVLNEIRVFRVQQTQMRWAMALIFLASFIIQIFGRHKSISVKWWSKYVIMTMTIAAVFVTELVLGQWATPAMLVPMLLTAQYHDRNMGWYSLIGCCFVAYLSAPLSCIMGLWDPTYYSFLLKACGYQVELQTIANFNPADIAMEVVRYVSLPRILIVFALSTIIFSVANSGAENLKNRIQAVKLSHTDLLTQIYNRNSFENKIEQYAKSVPDSLICVYADADGLHELNNNFGHAAGDELLVACAKEMTQEFGEQCYRIGGDEFVAFVEGLDVSATERKIHKIVARLQMKGYHMSFGISEFKRDEENNQNFQVFTRINDMINDAEASMYDEKHKYYEQSGRCR